jgi:hypothetical protein
VSVKESSSGGSSDGKDIVSDTESERLSQMFDPEDEEKQIREREIKEMNENLSKKYLQMCRNEKVLPLPTIHKITEGVL